jgi:hypothetical protein
MWYYNVITLAFQHKTSYEVREVRRRIALLWWFFFIECERIFLRNILKIQPKILLSEQMTSYFLNSVIIMIISFSPKQKAKEMNILKNLMKNTDFLLV